MPPLPEWSSFVSQSVSPVSTSSAQSVACISPPPLLPSPPPTISLSPICKTACPQLRWFPLCTDHTLFPSVSTLFVIIWDSPLLPTATKPLPSSNPILRKTSPYGSREVDEKKVRKSH